MALPLSTFAMRQKPFPDWRGTRLGEPTYAEKLQNWQTEWNVDALGNPVTGAGAAGAAAPGNLAGAPPFNYSGPYGGVPQVPDPVATAATAIKGNLGNLGDITNLASTLNAFNTQQAINPLIANLPGYQGLVNQSSANILSNLQGQLPQDVVNLLRQQAAERGVAIGSPGSPNQEAALLRALGLTSLDLMGRGEAQLTGAVGRTPVGPQFNPASLFVSPEQQQSAQAASNLYAAAPIPAQKAAADLAALRAGVGSGRTAAGSGSPVYFGVGRPQPAAPGAFPTTASSYYNAPGTGGPNYYGSSTPFTSSRPADGVSPEVAALAGSLNGNSAYLPGFGAEFDNSAGLYDEYDFFTDDFFDSLD